MLITTVLAEGWPLVYVKIVGLAAGIMTCAVLSLGFLPRSANASEVADASKPAWSATLAKARAATVSIECTTVNGTIGGSGIILTESGLIATNAHVITGASAVRVKRSTDEVYDAVGIVDFDARLDLAFILIPGFGLPTAIFGNSDSLLIGQHLLAIGAPLGLDATVSDGLLSATRIEEGQRKLQISVPVSPGSSGGPILNDSGLIVGLVVSGIRGGGAENLNFGIPINYVRGKLGILAGKTPTPFSEMKYPDSSLASGNSVGSAGGSTGERVNANLDLDFSILDGVELYIEVKGDGQRRTKVHTSYSVSKAPDGSPVLERIEEDEIRNQGLLAGLTMAFDQTRTVFQVGPANKWTTSFLRRPIAPDWEPVQWDVHVEGTRYKGNSKLGSKEGDAPPGVFPREFIGAVIAALPDSLPEEIHLWVLDVGGDRAQEVVIRRLGYETIRVPVAAFPGDCSKDASKHEIDVPAVRLSKKAGPRTETVLVLAHRPHVTIDNAKCLFVPGMSKWGYDSDKQVGR